MARSFDIYKVSIEDKTFYRQDGFSTEQTAHIILFNSKGKEIEELFLAYPKLNEIYEAIENGNPVNLDSCYIKGFSLTACRRYLLKNKFAQIDIESFSAQNAFCHSPYDIDFSFANFKGEKFNLSNTSFVGGYTQLPRSYF